MKLALHKKLSHLVIELAAAQTMHMHTLAVPFWPHKWSKLHTCDEIIAVKFSDVVDTWVFVLWVSAL
jgi:hypothetical protein